jgi:hypothetical protein
MSTRFLPPAHLTCTMFSVNLVVNTTQQHCLGLLATAHVLVTKNWKGRSRPYIFARFHVGFVLQPQVARRQNECHMCNSEKHVHNKRQKA